MKALSIQQPWAHLIIYGQKNIENRRWQTNLRGRIYIHASKKIDRYAYDQLIVANISMPHIVELKRGGIIGTVDLLDCVKWHVSRWFFGPYGFVLGDPHPLPFIPCRGALKFFEPKGE